MARFRRLITYREVTKWRKVSKVFFLKASNMGLHISKKRSYNFISAESKTHTEEFHQKEKQRGSRKEC